MEDDSFHKFTLLGLILIILLIFLAGKYFLALQKNLEQTKCSEVVDMIYEQCQEEQNISIQTFKGRNTVLEYDRGVCVIK
jgi:hypothetical protein